MYLAYFQVTFTSIIPHPSKGKGLRDSLHECLNDIASCHQYFVIPVKGVFCYVDHSMVGWTSI